MEQFEGTLLAVTRRHARLITADGTVHEATVGSRSLEPVVGDHILWEEKQSQVSVEKILPRSNCLLRSYERKTKRLAANLDHLLIVVAPEPLLNLSSVDRMLAAAHKEGIPSSLVLNKSDLAESVSAASTLERIYRPLGTDLYTVSAKHSQGLESLLELLHRSQLKQLAIAGVSGVGKSSLLNRLVPASDARTGEVSKRSGQGKQTTSHVEAHIFSTAPHTLVVDLPGIQNFGVSHLSEEEVRNSFEDFHAFSSQCRFHNCWHIAEPDCGVTEAVESGLLSSTRREAYLDMLAEVRASNSY